jgi:hypothetical protein
MAKAVRWVQYEARVFVLVEVDESQDTEVTKMVTANDVEELQLARDDRGGFRVYDEQFEPVEEDEAPDGNPRRGVDRRGPAPVAGPVLPGMGRRH